jgi:hypothetical protein
MERLCVFHLPAPCFIPETTQWTSIKFDILGPKLEVIVKVYLSVCLN